MDILQKIALQIKMKPEVREAAGIKAASKRKPGRLVGSKDSMQRKHHTRKEIQEACKEQTCSLSRFKNIEKNSFQKMKSQFFGYSRLQATSQLFFSMTQVCFFRLLYFLFHSAGISPPGIQKKLVCGFYPAEGILWQLRSITARILLNLQLGQQVLTLEYIMAPNGQQIWKQVTVFNMKK